MDIANTDRIVIILIEFNRVLYKSNINYSYNVYTFYFNKIAFIQVHTFASFLNS